MGFKLFWWHVQWQILPGQSCQEVRLPWGLTVSYGDGLSREMARTSGLGVDVQGIREGLYVRRYIGGGVSRMPVVWVSEVNAGLLKAGFLQGGWTCGAKEYCGTIEFLREWISISVGVDRCARASHNLFGGIWSCDSVLIFGHS